jgi:hypothetical protein
MYVTVGKYRGRPVNVIPMNHQADARPDQPQGGRWTVDSEPRTVDFERVGGARGTRSRRVDGTAPYISPYTARFAPIYLVSTSTKSPRPRPRPWAPGTCVNVFLCV